LEGITFETSNKQKLSKMKNLSQYKASYKKAKSQVTKRRIMNAAMLNLSHDEQQKFMRFQIEEMSK
jgi:hypothetical protein